MNTDLQNLTPKVEDGGTTPQGKLAASEWNILLEAVKLLDRTSGEIGTSEVLRIVRDAGYATQDWVNELIAGISTPNGYVSIVGDQQITGVKDFVNGLRIGGAPITYDATTQSFFFEGNIVLSGGVAMRAALGALDVPTVMDALRVDGSNLKVIDGVLTFVGQTGGGVADSVAWANITDKPSWIGSTKPSYNYSEITGTPDLSAYLTASALSGYATQDWVLSQKYLTGISSSMVTDALGFTPFNGTKANIQSTLGISDWALASTVPTLKKEHLDNLDSATPWTAFYSSFQALNRPDVKGNYSTGITLGSDNIGSVYLVQLGLNYYGAPFTRYRAGGVWSDWKQIAFTDSNVASATKLQTPRTIWGQSFDGTGNVENRLRISGYASTGSITKISDLFEKNQGLFVTTSELGNGGWGMAFWVEEYGHGCIQQQGFGDLTNTYPLSLQPIGGNVGIGTISPSEKLEVNGNIKASEITLIKNYQSDNRSITINGEGIKFNQPSGGWAFANHVDINSTNLSAAGILGEGKAVKYYYYGGTYNFPSAVILPNGNMVIGGLTSSEKLHVYGNILASGDITMRYTSDMRLKRNRESIKASEILLSLGEVQSFEYVDSEVAKNHRYAGRHFGLMYQNVKGSALDRMCHEREDGFGSLNYIDTSYLALLGGVGQEHELRIRELERENRDLREKVYKLERMV